MVAVAEVSESHKDMYSLWKSDFFRIYISFLHVITRPSRAAYKSATSIGNSATSATARKFEPMSDKPNFYTWLVARAGEDSIVGDLATDVKQDHGIVRLRKIIQLCRMAALPFRARVACNQRTA
jgi:hypothetical protein